MNIRRILTMLAVTASAGIVMLVLPVLAHHASTPFYDPDNVVDLQGTVTRFVFRNPHAFLFINVPEEDGHTDCLERYS